MPETDTICIDYIDDITNEYVYLPYSINGKAITKIGNGKPCMPEESCRYLYIPETLTEIGDYAFLNCRNFVNLNYYNYDSSTMELNQIGLQAFYGTQGQRDAESNHSTFSVNKILYRCFSSAEEFAVSDYYTIIADDAFAHNADIKTIILPDTITKIGEGAFYHCDSLTTITIPDSVTSIGKGAFVDCTALEQATLGSGLTEIGSDLFTGCTSLKKINAPEGSKAAETFADQN